MRPTSLLLKFCVELAAFTAFAVWGWHVAGWWGVALAPAAGIAVWGRWAAPKSERRLPARWRIPLELAVLGLGAAALAHASHPSAALWMLGAVILSAVLLTVLDQWEH